MTSPMKDESTVQQEVQRDAMLYHSNLMRNNCGACEDITGRIIRYGLGNVSKQHQDQIASSDLIGITKIIITPDMVGETIGVFTAVEVKKESWKKNKKLTKREKAQKAFIDWVKSLGGFAGFANSADDLKEIIIWN